MTNHNTGNNYYSMSKPCMHCMIALQKSKAIWSYIAWSVNDILFVKCPVYDLITDHISGGNRSINRKSSKPELHFCKSIKI